MLNNHVLQFEHDVKHVQKLKSHIEHETITHVTKNHEGILFEFDSVSVTTGWQKPKCSPPHPI